ncbi:DUF4271 domain-containing protein [Chryseobacterium koreense]
MPNAKSYSSIPKSHPDHCREGIAIRQINLIFARKYKLVRIAQQNDWVVFILVGSIFLYIFMLLSLQRESSVRDFLLQKFPDSSNNFPSWLIISLVFVLLFSTLVSQFIPIVPRKISEVQIMGYELNKFGFTFLAVSGIYFIKNICSYLYYAGTGNSKKWKVFYFAASKIYFVFSLVLMVACVVKYFYSIESLVSFNLLVAGFLVLFGFKLIFYFFHRDNILPQKWYYKILYICTLQITPVLVLWKILFF